MLFNEEELRAIILAGSLALLFFSVFIIVLVVLFNRNLQRKEREGFRQVLKAVEQERQQIGQNLHDDIGAMLSGIKLSLEAYVSMSDGKPDVLDAVKEHKVLMSEVIASVRRSAHNLAPVSLQKYGLVATIEEQCNLINKDENWSAHVLEKQFPDKRISGQHALNLYRILSELMNNSLKHSQGSIIEISFICATANELVITYSDNGVGLGNPDAAGSGLGMSGLKTRIKLLEGKYAIKPGSGFCLEMRFDLKQLEHADR